MSSRALEKWDTTRARELDEIVAAHRAMSGDGPGRRRATQQIVHAYAVLLSSQFQGFCRDLHSEMSSNVATAASTALARDVLAAALTARRELDKGNPTPGNIGNDFNRFGDKWWDAVYAHDRRNESRRKKLETMNLWRNAIAHQDFAGGGLDLDRAQRRALRLADVKAWRTAAAGLAVSFDAVAADRVKAIVGRPAW